MTKTAMREIVREIREVLRDTETAITNEDGFLMYDCLNDIDLSFRHAAPGFKENCS